MCRIAATVSPATTSPKEVRTTTGRAPVSLSGAWATGGVASSVTCRVSPSAVLGVAEGCVLTRDVKKDEYLTYADVELPQGRLVDALREEQAGLA